MDLQTIKAAVLNGQTVCWSTTAYLVKYNERGGFNIVYTPDGNCIGLTHQDGVTLNGKDLNSSSPLTTNENTLESRQTNLRLSAHAVKPSNSPRRRPKRSRSQKGRTGFKGTTTLITKASGHR